VFQPGFETRQRWCGSAILSNAHFAPCRTAPKGFRLALDDIKKLMDDGKGKDYLTYNEVNDLIPHGVHSPEDRDDLLTVIGTRGIDVLEGQPKLPSSALEKRFAKEVEIGEDVALDLTPGVLETTSDPARIYLREIGVVPLLTREEWTCCAVAA